MAEFVGSGATPAGRRILKTAAVSALALYGAGALILFFWPDGEAVRLLMIDLWYRARDVGLPRWVSPEAFSVAANAVAFLPAGFALAALLPRVKWWVWGWFSMGVSGGIELIQMIVLDSRVPELADVLANGLGGFIGAWLGQWAARRSDRTQGGSP